MDFKREDLEQMKRVQLQTLCKACGVKANMKTAQLIEGLLQFSNKSKDVGTIQTKAEQNVEIIESQEKNIAKEERNSNTKELNDINEEEKQLNNVKSEVVQPINPQKEQLPKVSTVTCASKIPRLTNTAKPNNKKVAGSTPKNIQQRTPKRNTGPKDWSKIHKKQFEKMDSLGDYLAKKRKRATDLSSSKKTKLSQKNEVEQSSTVEKSSKKTAGTASKVPQATKTPGEAADRKKRLTFNLTKSARDIVTPGNAKRRATLGTTKTPTQGAQQKAVTPFRFSAAANTSLGLFSPTPRTVFDLKASLAKPLSYKPYSGKLPTPTYVKQKPKTNSAKKTISHEKDVKAVKVTSREARREKQKENIAKKRKAAVCKRRGLN